MRRRVQVVALALASTVVAGCGGGGSAPPRATGSEGATSLEGDLTVFAAASLTDAFTELEARFEEAHPGVDVTISYGASSSLREQILAGAPVDVYASADASNMDQVVGAGLVDDAVPFATNELQIAVPAGNPGEVTGLADLARDDLLVGLCAEEVPCGRLGRAALAEAGVTPSIDTNEPDVRSLLTKLEADDLDVGIVYRTDVLAAGDAVEGMPIADAEDVVARYPVAVLTSSDVPVTAAAFVDLLLGEDGQAVLEGFGFGPP